MNDATLSRRTALRQLLGLGAGVSLAALVGCGARNTALLPSPIEASTPTATPRPIVDATPAPPAEVRLNALAHTLSIPTLGLRAEVRPADSTRNALGRPEIVVPDHCLVTPNALMGRNAINNIWILGHSRWQGVPQPLFRLSELRAGDEVLVHGRDRTTELYFPLLSFRVQRLVLTDIESAPKELYGARPRFPRVVLQTSARQAGAASWILDRRVVEAKAEHRLDGDVDDPRKYLLLLVVGELTANLVAHFSEVPG